MKALHALRVLVLIRLIFGQYDNLRVVAVGIRTLHGIFNFIDQCHAVPDNVNALVIKLKDLVVPVDFNKLRFNAEIFCYLLRHIRVKTDPVAVIILIIHRGKIRDASKPIQLPSSSL